ncbi:MAG: geranylgeranyl reductase family protein [Thermoproteota archaeon]
MSYDVIVVGAGPAGSTAARYAAKRGLRVLLLDREGEKRIGNKVCGNALGSHHLREVELELPNWTNYGRLLGVKIHAPSGRAHLTVETPEYEAIMLDRLRFGQYLLGLARDAGVELKPDFNATSAVLVDGKVIGVKGVDVKTMEKLEFEANITIDASGVAGVLKRSMMVIGLDFALDNDETMVTYREIRRLTAPQDPTYADIFLDMDVAPGGYWWLFPMGKEMINVGVGVVKGSVNPRVAFEKILKRNKLLDNSSVLHCGGGIVPTRRPMATMVWNGIVFIGDAGFTVNPLHGGGIGSSMLAGRIAGEVLAEATIRGDFSIKGLWPMNLRYMESYGAKQASLDVMRIFLQGLNNEIINYGIEHQLIKQEDLLATSMGSDLRLNITEKAQRVFSGIGRIGFLLKLNRAAELMRSFKRMYVQYPKDPNEFESWIKAATSLHEIIHKDLGQN